MVVQRGHFEAIVQCGTHHGVHLVLEQHEVAHDHRISLLAREERCPGS
jgi:hypothetical protein